MRHPDPHYSCLESYIHGTWLSISRRTHGPLGNGCQASQEYPITWERRRHGVSS